MIKLKNILKEIDDERKKVVRPPMADFPEIDDEDFIDKGFKTKEIGTDPETGAVITSVEYLPKFEQIKRVIQQSRKEFQPFKYSNNPNVAKTAKEINTLLTKAANLVFALDKMIELERIDNKKK